METSRQLAFINNKYGFTISFINGSQILEEISHIHNIGPLALDFYKKTILGSTQLINYLKANESLGFYIDSEEPYFRFKLELSHTGSIRTLLLPEEFEATLTHFTGKGRLYKLVIGGKPYTSILEYQHFPIENIVNDMLEKSYQTQAKVLYSDHFENSLMITKLPPTNINLKIEDFKEISLENFILKNQSFISDILSGKYQTIEAITQLCEKEDFSYLGSHEIKFNCPCSLERMIENFATLKPSDIDSIFEATDEVETRCDYCNTIYTIHKNDIAKQSIH